MTDVYCEKRRCMNNIKGWCKANGIHIDGQCKSYAPPNTLMNGNVPRVQKHNRRYKRPSGRVIK